MAKIKAVLDQETWVSVDVPDEFQAIVVSLSSFDTPASDPELAESECLEEPLTGNESVQTSPDHPRQDPSETLTAPVHEKKVNSTPQTQSKNASLNEHGKSTSQTLVCRGIGYHMVNWLVFLYKRNSYLCFSGFVIIIYQIFLLKLLFKYAAIFFQFFHF